MSSLFFYHPAPSEDDALANQKEPTSITMEQLKKFRELPQYTPSQKLFALVTFIFIGIPKLILVLITCLVSVPPFVLLCIIWRSLGKDPSFRHFLQRYYSISARIFLFFCGFVHVDYKGLVDPEARFFVINHVCFFDGWLFLPFFYRPLAKKELFSTPIIKDMLDVYDGISVDRTHATGVSTQMVKSAIDPTRAPIALAPEGASTNGQFMFRFRLGAFLSDLPIQPIAVRYKVWGCSRKTHHMSYFHNYPSQFIHFFGIPAITAEIQFLESVSLKTDADGNSRNLADLAGLRIANHLRVMMIDLSSKVLYEVPANNEKAKIE